MRAQVPMELYGASLMLVQIRSIQHCYIYRIHK